LIFRKFRYLIFVTIKQGIRYKINFQVWHNKAEDDWVSIPGRGDDGICFFATTSRPALGPTQPPFQWVLEALILGIKRPGREAENLKPNAEFKNA